jgi:hypothetical protein
VAVAAGDGAGARRWFERGLAIAQRLAEMDPGNAGFQRDLALSLWKLGAQDLAAGQWQVAQARLAEAQRRLQALADTTTGQVQIAQDLARLEPLLAAAAMATGRMGWLFRAVVVPLRWLVRGVQALRRRWPR